MPTTVGNLLFGWQCFIDFAVEAGAILPAEGEDLRRRGRGALDEAAAAQNAHQQDSEPTQRFIDLVVGVLAAGLGHLAATTGGQPPTISSPDGTTGSISAGTWGWRIRMVHGKDEHRYEWQPVGLRIYLEPEASYGAAQRLARETGESLVIGRKTLHKRMHERGLLATTDSKRGKLTVRRTIEDLRRNVLHLRTASLLAPSETAQSALEAHGAESGEISRGSSKQLGPDPTATSASNIPQSAPGPSSTPAQHDAQLPLMGPDGPLGPIPRAEGTAWEEGEL